MGHKHSQPQPIESTDKPSTPAAVIPAESLPRVILPPEGELPPQPAHLLSGIQRIGDHPHVRCVVGGRVMTVELTDYDETNDTLSGVAKTVVHLDSGEPDVVTHAIRGLRPYPQPLRGDRAVDFQYVLCGQDESPLLNIANANAHAAQPSSGVAIGSDDESKGNN